MSETALREQAHTFIEMLSYEQVTVVNELLSFIITKDEPLIIETDLTEEEHRIIEASRQDYKNNPESFVNLSDLR
jgi:hypothetical protein